MTTTTNNATLEIHHNDGTDSRYPGTLRDAIRVLKARYGDDMVMGDWDTYGTDGAERMLVWATEADATNDDGAKAAAEIIRR